ncbi:MAG: aminopeptidase [Betaproteobacteria bacterium]|nr:aminopeptidase [Betaproteobacteria bacterium]
MTRLAFILALVSGLCGCTNIGYYYQAVEGQMQIWNRSRSIAQVIDDTHTPPQVRERLSLVLRVRNFASGELALPDNGSYRKYADLERPFVVWNVFAAGELSVAPKEWCFPFAGCVGYRGYFSQARAEQFGEELRRKGLDVFVTGIPAYSTLGWFDDPVLNTVMRYPDGELARLIFHELAHQVVYVPGDTVFNESFAVAVELEGVDRWLARDGDPAKRAAFELYERRKGAFIDLVMKYRDSLRTLYASAATDTDKRQKKAETFAAMKAEYLTLRSSWGGYAGYDRFFAEELNNAHLVPVATYSELVPGFRRVLAENGGDFRRFYAAVKEIGKLPKEQRQAKLKAG